MKITKEQAQEATYGAAPDGFTIVADTIIGHTRWSIQRQLVLADSSKRLWGATYSIAATECQDETPFEYSSDPVEFDEYEKISVPAYQRKS